MAGKTRQRRAFLSTYIYDSLRESLSSGAFPIGSKIPSEMALSKQFKASRMTIRGALKRLAVDGYIESKPGLGWQVVSSTPASTPVITKPVFLLPAGISEAMGCIKAAQEELEGLQLKTQLHLPQDPERMRDFDWTTVSAAIFFSGRPIEEEVVERVQAAGIPMVCMMLAQQMEYDTVVIDHFEATTISLSRLAEQGCVNPVYLSSSYLEFGDDPSFAERRRAVEAFAKEKGVEPLIFDAECNYALDMEEGKRFAKWLAQKEKEGRKPDAIYASTSGLIEFALVQLNQHGITAGTDIIVSGASLFFRAEALRPHGLKEILASGTPCAELGQVAARRIHQRLSGDKTPATCTRLRAKIEMCGGQELVD